MFIMIDVAVLHNILLYLNSKHNIYICNLWSL